MSLPTYYGLKTFQDIINATIEALKVQASDSVTINRIKRNINTVYTNQIVSSSRTWSWLNRTTVINTQPYYATGTLAVEQNKAYLTFSTPVRGSRKNWFIAIEGANEVHQIYEHEDLGTTATLTTRFVGATKTAARFRLWTDCIPLPTDCQTVRSVAGAHRPEPLDPISTQQIRLYQTRPENVIGKPEYYSEGPRVLPNPYSVISGLSNPVSRQSNGLQKTLYFNQDPTLFIQAGDKIRVNSSVAYEYDGNVTISAVSADDYSIQYTSRAKRNEVNTAVSVPNEIQIFAIAEGDQQPYPTLLIHPSIDECNHTNNLVVDYQAYPEPMLNPDDEPLIPYQHRQVLLFGAMWMSCDRDTDQDRAMLYKGLMDQEIQRMIAMTTLPTRLPKIEASKDYVRSKMRLPKRRTIIY